MEKWNRSHFLSMTERKKDLRKQGNLRRGKNLLMQEINRKRWSRSSGREKQKEDLNGRARPPDYREYQLSQKEWMQYLIMGAGAAGLCAYTFYRSVLAFLFLLPVAFLYPVYKKKDLKKERIRRLTLQFKEGIMVLASFLSAGYSLENSLSLSVKELEGLYGKTGMITEEFSYMEAGVRMNRPVELLLADMGRRSGIQDVDQFARVFAAAKRSGGELTDIISQTAGIIRDKIQVQEEIHTLTAARVFEQKIMNGIPFGIILYIDFTSPGFFPVMYETWLGRIFMTACLGIYVGAVFLAKKILDIPL